MSVTWHRQQDLDSDFDVLAARQRLQDEHRNDLDRRERELRDRQQACLLLEEHLTQRLQSLVTGWLLLEQAAEARLHKAA